MPNKHEKRVNTPCESGLQIGLSNCLRSVIRCGDHFHILCDQVDLPLILTTYDITNPTTHARVEKLTNTVFFSAELMAEFDSLATDWTVVLKGGSAPAIWSWEKKQQFTYLGQSNVDFMGMKDEVESIAVEDDEHEFWNTLDAFPCLRHYRRARFD